MATRPIILAGAEVYPVLGTTAWFERRCTVWVSADGPGRLDPARIFAGELGGTTVEGTARGVLVDDRRAPSHVP
jgi:hypothetical protein